MRFLVVVVTTGATLAFIAASGLMNWVFMTSLGKGVAEQHIFGAVSIAVSAFIASFPTLIVWAWGDRRFVFVGLGVPVFLAFVAFSLSSAVGFAAKNRGAQTEDRELATARLVDVKHEIGEAESRRKSLGTPRPMAVLQEAMRGLEQDRKWQGSKECTEVTREALRSFCRGYSDLKVEAANASELSSIDKKLANLKSEARGFEDKGAGREADNQAAVLANLLGLPPIKVERGLTLYLAVLVEIGAAFGLYFSMGSIRSGPPADTGSVMGATILEARVVRDVARLERAKPSVKQIAGPASGPRRVPRMKRDQNS